MNKIKESISKMTLKKKGILLDKIIKYYGLQAEEFIFKEIDNLNNQGGKSKCQH